MSQNTTLILRDLEIRSTPGAAIDFGGRGDIRIEGCLFTTLRPTPTRPKMDIRWLGTMGLLDPANPQKGNPG